MLRRYEINKNTHLFWWVSICAALQGSVLGQSEITVELLTDLPDGEAISWVTDVSDDGSVIVGTGETPMGTQAFRWENGALTWLGDLPGGIFQSSATSVSADGKIVVGSSSSEYGTEAFRWKDGVMVGLGDLPGGDYFSTANKISADGSTIIGVSHASSEQTAFRWRNGFMEELEPSPEGYFWKGVTGISPDGNMIFGFGVSIDGFRAPLMWQNDVTSIVDFGMGQDSTIDLVLENGDLLVGYRAYHEEYLQDFPFMVIDGDVMILPNLYDPYSSYNIGDRAVHASSDGSIITGFLGTMWLRELNYRPINWRDLLDYFGLVPEGFQIGLLYTVSGDGTTFVFNALRESQGTFDSIFRMVFPSDFTASIPKDEIQIPDIRLRTEISCQLDMSSIDPISQSDMELLTKLNCSGFGIQELTGLEAATNLTELYLRGCQITDFSALMDLENLKILELFRNGLTDISDLADLTSLEKLRLHQNNITDISPLRNLTNLDDLNLDSNEISDAGPIAGLTKLQRLFLGNNNLTNINYLSNLRNLIRLGLPNNQIRDISILSNLTDLNYLELYGNLISDIRPLASLVKLWDDENHPGLKLKNNYIDVSAGSLSRQIIDQLDSKPDLIVEYLPQREYTYWEGYPLRSDGTVDAWDWIGELNVDLNPWMWSEEMQAWVYLDSALSANGGGWFYMPNLVGLPVYEVPGTQICYHFSAGQWMLATDSGWVYLFAN